MGQLLKESMPHFGAISSYRKSNKLPSFEKMVEKHGGVPIHLNSDWSGGGTNILSGA